MFLVLENEMFTANGQKCGQVNLYSNALDFNNFKTQFRLRKCIGIIYHCTII